MFCVTRQIVVGFRAWAFKGLHTGRKSSGTFIGALLLAYVVWDHWPTANQSSVGVGWGGIMKGYVPPALIALILLASSVLQMILWRRRRPQAAHTDNAKPTLEILSPFDNEEVDLYEIVRGRVFPPDSNLQVLVFAGDKKWYPQRSPEVKGPIWSAKCQFGNADSPEGGGAYKIIAVSGSELKAGMWYSDLPSSGIRSNVVHLHRREITIEQKLSAALKEAKDANLRANEQRGTNEQLVQMYRESQKQLADLDWLKRLADEQAKNIAEHVTATLITYPHSGSLVLDGDRLVVTVGLKIRNESVFDITIRPKDITGSFSFKNQLLKEPAGVLIDDFRGLIENLKPMQTEVLVLEQLFRQAEAETITKCLADSNAKFWIGNLAILISVSNATQKVEPKPLRITAEAENIPLTNFKRNTNND